MKEMFLKKHKYKSVLDRKGIPAQNLFSKDEEHPEPSFIATGTYNENTNVLDVHKYVLSHLDKEIANASHIEKKVADLNRRIAQGGMKIIERRNLEIEVQNLEKEISKLKSETKKKEYLDLIEPLLEAYAKVIEEEGPHIWNGSSREFNPKKLSIISGCIQIAGRYAPLSLIMSGQPSKGLCPYCREPLETEDESRNICNACDFDEEIMIRKCKFSECGPSSPSQSNDYSNREIFLETLACHQGKQTADFPKDLMARMDAYCDENDIDKNLLYADDVRDIFKKIGYVIYKNINLFLYLYAGKKPPDLTRYEADLIAEYDAFMSIYNLIKGEEKGSALNARYILYILVVHLGIPHDRRDFQLPDTPLRSNDSIAREVFERLGWKFRETG